MTGLDTNVLVRFLVEDDPEQAERASALVERAVDSGERLYISDVVVCETVWVLSGAYRFRRPQIAATLGDLLRARELAFADTDRLHRALHAYERGRGDYADYLIREHARAAGCDAVATFDAALLKEQGFVRPAR